MSLGQNEATKLYYGIILDQENIIKNYTYKNKTSVCDVNSQQVQHGKCLPDEELL